MRTLALLLLFNFSVMYAQEQCDSEWKIMPSISVTKLFSAGNRHGYYDIQPMIYPPVSTFRISNDRDFSSTGILFSARFLNRDFEPFALTLSAGANWHRNRNESIPVPFLAYGGAPIIVDSIRMPIPISRDLRGGYDEMDRGHVVSFPVSVGAQVVFPYEKIDKLMFFAGVEANLHFMSERTYSRRQVEAGFSALGGVAIKMIEVGVRYARFAGQNHVGVQAGIRFNQFEL